MKVQSDLSIVKSPGYRANISSISNRCFSPFLLLVASHKVTKDKEEVRCDCVEQRTNRLNLHVLALLLQRGRRLAINPHIHPLTQPVHFFPSLEQAQSNVVADVLLTHINPITIITVEIHPVIIRLETFRYAVG
ncbi:hypothetical protein BLNAU_21940 [Blattamonas nauphoetae]|uniref:Uncharacterized protein n=1 Tax=Blattamonas nauphoetae TaxID=2049346 RepID=A0ABQ9WUF5_9EUKA|nr:hypothetical protein BLNAU_21940 [Blattamonas nauphoetae]